MKHGRMILFLAALAAGVCSGAGSGVVIHRSGELKGFEKILAAKMDAGRAASQVLDKFGNHLMQIAHREATGLAELHETQADIFVVESGEATLVTGGKMVEGKTTASHEIRGTSIEGGERQKVGAGDVVHIDANTPHQMLLDKGKQITYFVIKVDAK